MSSVVKALYSSNLDFAIRNTGTGSVSASDVILSTHGFKSFAFSAEDETVTIGSGFAWGEIDVRQVNAVAETFRDWQGKNQFWLCAPLLEHIDEQTLERAWGWWEKAYETYPGFENGSTVLLEFMQEAAYTSTPFPSSTAFPHHKRRHVMQLVLGCKPDNAPKDIRSTVMKLFEEAGPTIAGGRDKDTGEFHPGFLHQWNDLRQIYGENFERLREVKKKYDPENRFNKGVDLVNGKVGEGTTV